MTSPDVSRWPAIEQVREGASFYMKHRMREYPHPDAPDITMAEHKPNDPDCPACKAEAALARLAALADAAAEHARHTWGYCVNGDGRECPSYAALRAALAACQADTQEQA